jgi:cytoskeleton protein RodZ
LTSGPEQTEESRDDRSVGEILSEARQALGLTPDDLANQLKFSTRQIEALESGRYEQLPGGPFVRGMVRSYARLVNVDPGTLLARMAGAPGTADASPIVARFKQPVPFSDASRRSTMTYVALAGLALVIAVVVFFQWRQERAVPIKPTVTAPVLVTPAPEAPPQLAAGVTPPPTLTAPKPKPKPVPEIAAPARTAELPVETVGRQRVGLQVDEESWVEVKDAFGTTLLSQLIPAGRARTVEGEAPLSVVIGNAHHVQLTHNGNPVDLTPHIKVEVARLTLK